MRTASVALDARLEIEPGDVEQQGPNPALAIRPYPAELGEGDFRRRTPAITSGRSNRRISRSIRISWPRVSPEDIRLRFLAPRKSFPDEMLKRLTQLDYDRDMAFVALESRQRCAWRESAGCPAIPTAQSPNIALLVRTDLQGHGLGWALLSQIIDYAKAEGIGLSRGLRARRERAKC